jgi:nicotinamidase-related amidase
MEPNTNNTALLVMDMQQGILGNFPGAEPLLTQTKEAIAYARNKGIPVIYVVVGFRKGTPEINASNPVFGPRKEAFAQIDMDAFMKVHPDIAPLDGEVVVTKRRISAFTGSDLEVVLRGMGIRHLVLSGIATGGVVLATVVEAADKDYQLTVLSDCCSDGDEETHRLLLNKIFTKRGEVMTLEEWKKN